MAEQTEQKTAPAVPKKQIPMWCIIQPPSKQKRDNGFINRVEDEDRVNQSDIVSAFEAVARLDEPWADGEVVKVVAKLAYDKSPDKMDTARARECLALLQKKIAEKTKALGLGNDYRTRQWDFGAKR